MMTAESACASAWQEVKIAKDEQLQAIGALSQTRERFSLAKAQLDQMRESAAAKQARPIRHITACAV